MQLWPTASALSGLAVTSQAERPVTRQNYRTRVWIEGRELYSN